MTSPKKAKATPLIGVGMPAFARLNAWGAELYRAFGETAYLVGSAARGKTWRDVDVRIILNPPEYERICGSAERPLYVNPRWFAMVTALSLWGREQTGLPIDFQFQLREQVSEDDWANVRVPLGIFVEGEKVLT